MSELARRFTDEMDIRFLRPDDPVVQTITAYNPRRVYGQLLAPLAWEVVYTGAPVPPDAAADPAWVILPAGFISDGVTNVRWLWWFLPSWGHPIVRAALLHDWLIEQYRAGKPHPAYTTRLAIDRVFHEAARALKVHSLVASIAYGVVRGVALIKGERP